MARSCTAYTNRHTIKRRAWEARTAVVCLGHEAGFAVAVYEGDYQHGPTRLVLETVGFAERAEAEAYAARVGKTVIS